jgi:hypothetical protein
MTLRFSGSFEARGGAAAEEADAADGDDAEADAAEGDDAAGGAVALATFSEEGPGEGGPCRLHPAGSARKSHARWGRVPRIRTP